MKTGTLLAALAVSNVCVSLPTGILCLHVES